MVSFNLPLPFNYLEPLRDILVQVLGAPEKAWRNVASASKQHTKSVAVKQMPRRNGRHARA
jgi:hypothetical protein